MYIDANEHLEKLLKNNIINGPIFKMKNDPRVIKSVNFLEDFILMKCPR